MSNPESMQQLADKFVNDASFREEMRRDPQGAAERSGLPLDDEDKQALRSVDWSGSDEELKERVSKAYKASVVGFLNVLTGKLVRTVRQRGRGEDIAAGVQTLGDAECRRLLIWDNAPPHQARVARGAAEALGIEIVKLPFRSPELNPLEDLWRSLKAVVAANRAYGSVEELAERAVAYLDGLSEDDVPRLSGLLSSKFNWLPT